MAKKAWTPKQLELLLKLHGKMGSTNANEREVAHKHILKMLIDHDNSWNDMMELLQLAQQAQQSAAPPPPPPSGGGATALEPYQTIRAVYESHVSFDPDAYVICPLWAMHTHILRLFMHTPRLILRSPVRDCGKSTALRVTEAFVPTARRFGNATAATFFSFTNEGYNVLLDEVDNLDLMNNGTFRAALNEGYERDGQFTRVIQGMAVTFKVFAAVALAGIGTVPLPLARRSIIINLKRDPDAPRTRRKFNRSADTALDDALNLISTHLAAWAYDAKLTFEPPMPEQLTGGQCDVWRPLISIADACGAEVGEQAREIAVRMCRGLDQDPEIVLLRDVRAIFDEQRANRLSCAVILKDLLRQPHGWWSDWRGKDGTDAPRALSYGVMAKMLWKFHIRAKTVRIGRGPADTVRGYLRQQFEDAWQAYCSTADTSSQSSVIKHLQ